MQKCIKRHNCALNARFVHSALSFSMQDVLAAVEQNASKLSATDIRFISFFDKFTLIWQKSRQLLRHISFGYSHLNWLRRSKKSTASRHLQKYDWIKCWAYVKIWSISFDDFWQNVKEAAERVNEQYSYALLYAYGQAFFMLCFLLYVFFQHDGRNRTWLDYAVLGFWKTVLILLAALYSVPAFRVYEKVRCMFVGGCIFTRILCTHRRNGGSGNFLAGIRVRKKYPKKAVRNLIEI